MLYRRRSGESTSEFNLRDYYLTSLETGIRGLSPGYFRSSLARITNPLEYTRLLAFQLTNQMLGSVDNCDVLDIGSPKLLALFLALRTTARLHSVDILDDFIDPWTHFMIRMGGGSRIGQDVIFETQDARKLEYPNETFNRVYSISVFEHIFNDGDTKAIQEVARVLQPGGVAVITVPYRHSGYKEDFVPGNVYERKASANKQTFYQRHYDEQTLKDRILDPSGLELQELVHYGEPGFKIEPWWNRIPKIAKVPFMWLQPFVAEKFFTTLSSDQLDSASGIAIKLQKTTN
jgi:SAM-dependent methyltransferase